MLDQQALTELRVAQDSVERGSSHLSSLRKNHTISDRNSSAKREYSPLATWCEGQNHALEILASGGRRLCSAYCMEV